MGTVIVQKHTTLNPIQLIGEEAGICWGADITDKEKNYKRGLNCLSSEHFRTAEFPQVYLILDGYSARVIRELYTHIGGDPTRLQASTRYIDYENGFDYILPKSIKPDSSQAIRYQETIKAIQRSLSSLFKEGVIREDVAKLLNIGMKNKIVIR